MTVMIQVCRLFLHR